MGSVYNRGTKRKPNWWIKWRDRGHQRYKHIGEDKRLAERVLKKIEGDIVAGKAGLPDHSGPKPPKFDDALDAWVQRRKKTHRSWRHDKSKADGHLKGTFGDRRVDEVLLPDLVAYLDKKLDEGQAPASVALHRRLLSRFFNDLIEAGKLEHNPLAKMDRATRRRFSPRKDPRKTPFLRTKQHVRNVYLGFPKADHYRTPYRVMFAVGALGGLRTMEIPALDWERDIDLRRRRIHVQYQVQDGALTTLKDEDSRIVPIVDSLLPILTDWRRVVGGTGLLFPPEPKWGGRAGSPPKYRRAHTMHKHLRRALKTASLSEKLTWYQCTRHTFASHWIMDGRPIEKLRNILGHSSVQVTERYAHLQPDAFDAADYAAVTVDFTEPQLIELDKRRRKKRAVE